jgi:AraC-like DNA-binding protein
MQLDDSLPGPVSVRVLPGGSCDLVFALGGSLSTSGGTVLSISAETASVLGPTRRAYIAKVAGGTRIVGVRFKPGRAVAFLDEPLLPLVDSLTSLEDFWGHGATDALGEVYAERSDHGWVNYLSRVLRSRLRRAAARESETVAGLVRLAHTDVLVDTLAESAGLSIRTLQRRFATHVGLSPKLLTRMLRFRRAVRLLRHATPAPWSAMACACGYYDQAHFINDFRDFSGVTPEGYLRENSRLDMWNPYLRGLSTDGPGASDYQR